MLLDLAAQVVIIFLGLTTLLCLMWWRISSRRILEAAWS